jgi:D-alanyl-D-alanine carboxypeptidase/D-alanyl-D-alanine-endopeptidase (penicillin-binding protein 4)
MRVHARSNLLRALAFVAVVLTAAPSTLAEAPAPDVMQAALVAAVGDRAAKDGVSAVQVVSLRTGEEIFSRNADLALVPASTMKVVTAAAALDALGPSYRFKTELLRDGEIDSTGVLQGNLYIRGQGDPTLVVEKLWKLVYDLQLEGVKSIQGDLVFDDSFFGGESRLPGWDKEEDIENGPSYFPPLSALSINFNTVALVVGPGETVGSAARLLLETPADGYVELENKLKTVKEGASRRVNIEREATETTTRFVVDGSVPMGSPTRRVYRTVEHPTAHFQAAFVAMLKRNGVEWKGKARVGVTPAQAEKITELKSAPLATILMDMNKYSNNFTAEQVLLALGAETGGLPGTTEKGVAAVQAYLTKIGIPASEYHLVNGSGLSRDIKIRPTLLTAVMVAMAQDPSVGREFAASLAIAGRDGTLWQRLRDEPDRMRGKTGTLDGVHCLTGYLYGADGEAYAFAFLSNEVRSIAKVKGLHDSLARGVLGASAVGPAVVEDDTEAAQ